MGITLPKLYKKNTNGKLQEWQISVAGSTIITVYGQVDGELQTTSDTKKSGTNIGRSNERDKFQQAEFEAKAKWTKQKKSGYVEKKSDAEEGKLDKLIEGGHKLMKGKTWEDFKHKIKYPCAIQPKLDGIRAGLCDGKLWSYTRKPINTAKHIIEELKMYGFVKYPFDGELYNHDLKNDFESIVSTVRNESGDGKVPAHKMQYHVYDLVLPNSTFRQRLELMEDLDGTYDSDVIQFVETHICKNEAEVLEYYEEFLEQGYEGAVVRQLDAKYEGKKGTAFLKMKLFQDAEFKIVGIEEGKGKLQGHAAKFVCEINDKHGKRTFRAKMEGKTSFLKECFENHKLWKNRILTVKFMGYTNKNKLPRHPVAKAFRDDGL